MNHALTLHQRAAFHNQQFPNQLPLVVGRSNNKFFLHGFWFLGGDTGNISNFYGSYQKGYLEHVQALFPDAQGAKEVVHLFSGSLPPSPDYTRVGKDYTGEHKSDLEIDVHSLSSFLGFSPSLIYADPPYSVEDSQHYQCGELNRARVLDECAAILEPGGYIVWLDQALPTFGNDRINLIGGISYIRSTGNRFRLVSLFRKPLTKL